LILELKSLAAGYLSELKRNARSPGFSFARANIYAVGPFSAAAFLLAKKRASFPLS